MPASLYSCILAGSLPDFVRFAVVHRSWPSHFSPTSKCESAGHESKMTAFLHQQQSTQSMAEELTTAKPSTTHTRKRRRTRMIASCLECRRRKVGCTKELPCAQCRRYARECLYLAPALELMTQQRGQERQPPAESLEELLGRASVQETTRQSISNPSPPSSSAESASPPGETLTTENEKYLEPAASEIIDAIHADDADESVQDLGVRIGKMRMTDRVGGLHRPNIHKEVGTSE